MTAIAPQSAQSLQQLAPNVTPRVREGDLAKVQNGLLVVGLVLIAAAWATGKHFYASYLVGYMGVLGICLGALFFTMIQHITRAGWSVLVRRLSENISGVLPFMLLLFIPILIGFGDLFHHWAHADLTKDAVLAGKSSWLNSTFFFVRVGIYFAVWIGLSMFFRGQSIKQDENGDPAISLRLSRAAAPGLLLLALATTFAAFDWIMSLDPHWFSTIFGITYFAGGMMSYYAVMILLATWLLKRGYLQGALTTEHFHDLGKLMFVFVVFWTYTNFSQYMLIWYANLPEETHWFAERSKNGWGSIGTVLVLGHFFIPFVFLLSRHVKRHPIALPAASIFLLVIHCFDMQFLILPSVAHGAEHAEHAAGTEHAVAHGAETAMARFTHGFGEYVHQVDWADFGCFLGLLSIMIGITLFNIRRAHLVPVRDPRLGESLNFINI